MTHSTADPTLRLIFLALFFKGSSFSTSVPNTATTGTVNLLKLFKERSRKRSGVKSERLFGGIVA
eukprot:m.5553 g.5553  ORF g.5553 m.5553 type:complete len:65 (+) comp6704_c0_seq1:363-557(+)